MDSWLNRNPGFVQTSSVLEFVALSCSSLRLHMIVIMKGLLSLYNIDLSIIHKAQNAKVLCVFKNPVWK